MAALALNINHWQSGISFSRTIGSFNFVVLQITVESNQKDAEEPLKRLDDDAPIFKNGIGAS